MTDINIASKTLQGRATTTEQNAHNFYASALNLSVSFNEESQVDLYCHADKTQTLDELQATLEELVVWVQDRRAETVGSTPTV